MDADKMSNSIRRIAIPQSVNKITVLQKDSRGAVVSHTVFQRGGGKKKVTPAFRPFETAARRIADANARAGQSYLMRHKKSNQKRRDGWMVDMPVNLLRASRKGTRALRLDRFLFF